MVLEVSWGTLAGAPNLHIQTEKGDEPPQIMGGWVDDWMDGSQK